MIIKSTRKIGWCVLSVLLIPAAHGCGGSSDGVSRAAVKGSARLDGKPIQQGTISFFPTRETKGPVVGALISEGQYELPRSKGPVIGWNQVQISWRRKTGRKIEAGSPAPPGHMVDEITEAVPAQFNSESTLEREIQDKKNVLDFNLISE